jgi:hypothetical protein
MTFVDADTLQQEWLHYEKGKPSPKSVAFTFKRTQSKYKS